MGRGLRLGVLLALVGAVLLLAVSCLLAPSTAAAGTNVWTTNGPFGAAVTALAVDPQNGATVYIATFPYGWVFKSTDAGASWVRTGLELGGEPYVSALIVDPADPQVLYVSDRNDNNGIYKSTDGGQTWAAANTGLPPDDLRIFSLVMDPTNPQILYVAVIGHVFKTTDGAQSWSEADMGLTNSDVLQLALDPTHPQTVFATLDPQGLMESMDGGDTWARVPSDLRTTILSLVVDPAESQTLYAATYDQGVKRSTDGGLHWSSANNGLTNHHALDLVVDPTDPLVIYVITQKGAKVYQTQDGGSTWSPAGVGLRRQKVRAIAIDPTDPNRVYAGAFMYRQVGGVYRSTDGGSTWVPENQGLAVDMEVLSLAVDPISPGTVYAGTLDTGIFKSTDSGVTWSQRLAGVPVIIWAIAIDPSDDDVIYAGSEGGGVIKSTDGGRTWHNARAGLRRTPRAEGSLDVRSLLIDPVHPNVLYAGTAWGVYKSTDAARSWHRESTGIPFVHTFVFAFAVDPVDTATVYAGGEGLYKTTDGGRHWTPLSFGPGRVNAIVIDPANSDVLHAAAGASVFTSSDAGATWAKEAKPGGYRANVNALAMPPPRAPAIYAGTGAGVFSSLDGGHTWSEIDQGLIDMRVGALGFGTPSTLYAGTGSTGVFSFTFG